MNNALAMNDGSASCGIRSDSSTVQSAGRGGARTFTGIKTKDWGTAIALGVIGVLLGGGVYLTVKSDMGYVVDAFT